MANTKVSIGKGLTLKNPIMTASGTFGYGVEFEDFVDLNSLGGILVKGTTLHHREGNLYPRMAETPAGMLNAVGLQNKGVDYFCREIYPDLLRYEDAEFIVNVSGSSISDYCETAKRVGELEHIRAIELNISCPNVKEGGMAFGVCPESAAEVVRAVRKTYDKTLIVKLSPNVSDIRPIAKVVEEEGADAISLINTLVGMAVDIKKRRPVLSTITGGMSGPAVKPIALRMVWQVAQTVDIPVIGMGGISTLEDVIEFLLVGASAVEIGYQNFVDPSITGKLVQQLDEYMERENIENIYDLIGGLRID
ncbi:dihydroorotate dehydrogenase [Falsiporphyromonas endometrii]|uniref:Dihydroorotate dehydrogenase n=1 Tax=Falsiporphyromonas endometrii TaxID=1387297 RepID=A0ABV9K7R4_9PORP